MDTGEHPNNSVGNHWCRFQLFSSLFSLGPLILCLSLFHTRCGHVKYNHYSIVGSNFQKKVTFPVNHNCLYINWISNHSETLETIARISQLRLCCLRHDALLPPLWITEEGHLPVWPESLSRQAPLWTPKIRLWHHDSLLGSPLRDTHPWGNLWEGGLMALMVWHLAAGSIHPGLGLASLQAFSRAPSSFLGTVPQQWPHTGASSWCTVALPRGTGCEDAGKGEEEEVAGLPAGLPAGLLPLPCCSPAPGHGCMGRSAAWDMKCLMPPSVLCPGTLLELSGPLWAYNTLQLTPSPNLCREASISWILLLARSQHGVFLACSSLHGDPLCLDFVFLWTVHLSLSPRFIKFMGFVDIAYSKLKLQWTELLPDAFLLILWLGLCFFFWMFTAGI